jgi:hypothetical protein
MPLTSLNRPVSQTPFAMRSPASASPQFSGLPWWRKRQDHSSDESAFAPTLSRIPKRPDPETTPVLKALLEAAPPLPHLGHLLQAVSDYTQKLKVTGCHSGFYANILSLLNKAKVDMGSIDASQLMIPFKALIAHGWVTQMKGGLNKKCDNCFKPVITDAGTDALKLFNTWLNWDN